ncbi:MAG: phage shock protein operon transcriptional activator [Sphingomonadales bacterium]|nr:MAG: phage shock protein operon transcriptional activator [Sphingomonadales bacterium]
MVGQSAAFLDAMEHASAVAGLNRPVLVIGERGTGKELVAERVHRLSARWDQPFLQMNCAALSDTLIDAELFGYEAGAFTGAARARAGRFEEADGGTLFLDEIATLSSQAQEKLLRVIEYGQLQRIGSNKTLTVDVRVVGATNEDLPALAARGRFRADLLDRLSFDVVTLPPLRARADDIPLLADFFGRRMAAELGWRRYPGFSPGAQEQLLAHDWPGNVRELKNVVERAVYRWGDPDSPVARLAFDPFESPWRPRPASLNPSPAQEQVRAAPSLPNPEVPSDFRASVAAYECDVLTRALNAARYNQRAAASALGLSYDQFRHCLRKHGLQAEARSESLKG